MTEELIDRLRAMYVANGTNYVQAAADKLEAQAERIKFLEADRNLEKKMRKDADEYADTLRAQLAEIEMTKEQMLEIIKLLSALESWSFSAGHRMPDYLFEKIDKAMDELTHEVLK